ncbi:LysR family transcriptional regulator [Sorangium sp. So ce1099]|uniref:LysR family transcriptional regulator n=1 Tax=Sorangium sp. So ce1099 TaxID=3133331 RepID=UPI003F609306
MNLATVNLNLLVALDALLAERHVTRAAARVGVTQSAMSNALRQLRALFDDPLFVRGPRGVTPTPRALALAEPVRRGLATLSEAFAEPRFDPASAERTVVLAASDYVELVLLPPLLARIAREAPGVRLEVRPWGLHEVPDALARGELDLVLGYFDRLPPRHRRERLFEERFVCLARRGHPRIRARLTLKAWAETPHVVVSERDDGPTSVDRALAARGLRRTIGVRVSHFLLVPSLVAKTDLVAALSRRVAEPFAAPFGLRIFPPPIELPAGRVGMVWHERLDADPGHAWLRGVISDVAAHV